MTVLTFSDTGGSDTLVIFATGPDSGTYSFNDGALTPFSSLTQLNYTGGVGADSFVIINPAGGMFAPVDGIFFSGGGQAGDVFNLEGGAGTSGAYAAAAAA